MKCFVFVVFFALSVGGFAQEVLVDPEDKEFQDDLFLSERDFYRKYLTELTASNSPDQYYQAYQLAQTVETKIFVLRAAAENVFTDPVIVQLFTRVLHRDFNILMTRAGRDFELSRIQVAAAFLISEKGGSLDEKAQQKFASVLLKVFTQDASLFCRAAYALALARLFANSAVGGDNESVGSVSKGFVVKVLNDSLAEMQLNPANQFFCWVLVKALGILKDPSSFSVLVDTRRKTRHQKLVLEISRSLQAVSGK